MKESRWRLQFRPRIAAMLAEIPADTPEAQVKKLMRGRGPTDTSHLPKMWRKELAAQLAVRFRRPLPTKRGQPLPLDPDQLSLL